MNRLVGIVLAAAAGAFLMAAPALAAKKVALVVGNSNYSEAPLRNPVNDARAVARQLRAKGFDVLLKENVTKAQFGEAVADFGEKLAEGDTALFFYAGHGLQVQGRNYLVPVDARITSEQRVRLETMDVEAILDQTTAAKAKVSLVILDACRNNPFERRFRSTGGGLAQINAPEGTLIAYATAPGKIAADGDGSNGLYTQALLKSLAEPGLKVEEVFKQVRIEVARASGGNQIPWEASSLTGDFFFEPPVEQTAVREVLFWDSVKGSNDPSELKAYLAIYPNGHFAPIARARIAAVEAARAQEAAQAEAARAQSEAAKRAADEARVQAEAARNAEAQEKARLSPESERADRLIAEFRNQSSRQVASVAGAVPRVTKPISTSMMANIGPGIVAGAPVSSFITIEENAIRLTASNSQSNSVAANVRCFGVGTLEADLSFAPIDFTCYYNTDFEAFKVTGQLTENRGRYSAQMTIENPKGRKFEVQYR